MMRTEDEVKEALELMRNALDTVRIHDPDPRLATPIANGIELIRWILKEPSEFTEFIDHRRENKADRCKQIPCNNILCQIAGMHIASCGKGKPS